MKIPTSGPWLALGLRMTGPTKPAANPAKPSTITQTRSGGAPERTRYCPIGALMIVIDDSSRLLRISALDFGR